MVEFGNHNIEASTSGLAANFVQVTGPFTPSVSGTLTDIYAYLAGAGLGGPQVVRTVIYADSAGAPGALLAQSGEIAIQSADAPAWRQFGGFALALSVLPYWLGFDAGANSTNANCYFSATGSRNYKANTYPTAPDPFGTPTGSDTQKFSIYGVYTIPGGGPPGGGIPETPPSLWHPPPAPSFPAAPAPSLWNKASD